MIVRKYEGWIIVLILFAVLMCLSLFTVTLAVEVRSKLCLLMVMCLVYIYIWSNFKKNSERMPKFSVSRQTLSYKCTAYVTVLAMSIFWSCLGSLLGGGLVDYAFDLILFTPIILGLLVIHTYIVDRYYSEQEQQDEHYKLGKMIASKDFFGLWSDKQILLKLVLKAFFIPFMYEISLGGIERLLFAPKFDWMLLVHYSFIFGIMFDVVIAFCGYIFATRLIDNQIVSVEDDWKGWFFCLICYPPFIFLLPVMFKVMESNVWGRTNVLDEFISALIFIQACTWVIYWWSTVEFGLKFSNLTWRGLVSSGPYAWTKHPAYLSKNIYWWINVASYMFITNISLLEKAKIIGLMTLVSLFYYGRCKCEERHLLNFREYQVYSAELGKLKWWQVLPTRR